MRATGGNDDCSGDGSAISDGIDGRDGINGRDRVDGGDGVVGEGCGDRSNWEQWDRWGRWERSEQIDGRQQFERRVGSGRWAVVVRRTVN